MSAPIGWAWRPIVAPAFPAALESVELRAFEKLWQRQRGRLEQTGALGAFTSRMARWWSIETGILERLYDVSPGITIALVDHGFEAALIPHGEATLPAEQLVQILESQRQGLDMVMDVVGGQRQLTTGWIKELHALLTQHQDSSEAVDQFGTLRQVPLRKGAYKLTPNNPLRSDGQVHEYSPVEHVASEMERLVDIHSALPATLPEVRSAWLHHAFTQIHPFQDGNGRVARALASIDLIRAGLFPVLVERSMRNRYIDALESADRGDLKALVGLFAECETRVLTRAISEAESIVSPSEGIDAVLASARNKRQARHDVDREKRRALGLRIEGLVGETAEALRKTSARVCRDVPGVKGTVQKPKNAEQRRWKARQLKEIGQRLGHWVDLNEPRTWIALRLLDGGITDIVFAGHFIGRPSPGAGVAVCYIEHRAQKRSSRESQSALSDSDALPLELVSDALLLAADEGEESQRERFVRWREEALVAALARWTQYL
jgi:fido (protein-threonine AMPylation protein)